ncbi:hypothetical protein IU459_19545 [Nocardia amamiensis]|uniref:Luciferase-like domain-containing protein n=1 Tax=Nocardia amamiensis TaxID=404578 RepID=A0ABS0CV96_9NOCA|nr:hypothetical protein [Nocardia amamiensis]
MGRHCDDIGRDYDQIRKTCPFAFDVGPEGEQAPELVGTLKRLADIGIDMVIGRVTGMDAISPLEVIGREVIPAVAEC